MKRTHLALWSTILSLSTIAYAINLPPSYGKTQFIVGLDPQQVASAKPTKKDATSKKTRTQVYFAPDDDIRKVLLNLIKKEQQSIRVAAFALTDRDIAQALVDARNRGIVVEVVVDQSSLKGFSGKTTWLHEQGIPVHVYVGVTANVNMSNIMHNKFIIFGKNQYQQAVVSTGSYNFTHSAQANNQENLVVLYEPHVVEKFAAQFDVLKGRCVGCEKVNGITKDKKELHAAAKRVKKSDKIRNKNRQNMVVV